MVQSQGKSQKDRRRSPADERCFVYIGRRRGRFCHRCAPGGDHDGDAFPRNLHMFPVSSALVGPETISPMFGRLVRTKAGTNQCGGERDSFDVKTVEWAAAAMCRAIQCANAVVERAGLKRPSLTPPDLKSGLCLRPRRSARGAKQACFCADGCHLRRSHGGRSAQCSTLKIALAGPVGPRAAEQAQRNRPPPLLGRPPLTFADGISNSISESN
ncbi:hypothetical protein B0T26DRAFT_437177 [Lasiosphaeria miniovina]|uniref:Uncharacterized protein n=1 Tax=Lasiosphaeria miniovina TaxID=1954250 RepID=A0AA39ZYA4_9PEZI|nr:uncharacterized protein B0T26DRAFT_437177 [Lasiosphaeria miniovina]KAK0705865.1 hypothetical protein B0T26DRAFT_437177 [Lasiosphaeria miniovina]